MAIAARVCVAILLCAAAVRADGPVRIVRNAPAIERRTFDPKRPPAEMPPLAPGEAAVTAADFAVTVEMSCRPASENRSGGRFVARLRVESVSLTTSVRITIWLPHGAPRALVEHEEGHRVTNERFYAEAERICRDAAAPVIGQVLTGEGASPTEARREAIRVAAAELSRRCASDMHAPSAEVNRIYDRITDHGRNSVPVDEAIRRAMDEYRAKKDAL